MKAIQLFRQAIETLTNVYFKNEAELISKILLEHCSGVSFKQNINLPETELNETQEDCFNRGLARLLNHEPIQYVTGETWFYNLLFRVNRDVLIPRPETEELVELVIKYAAGKTGALLDVGTGSGCIPIAFLKNTAGWTATAIDVSPEAIIVAKKNADRNGVALCFEQLDFLKPSEQDRLGAFDIIVSNPPYIPESEKENLEKNVRMYEPHQALFVEEAMVFYKAIAAFGNSHLKERGMVFLEVHQQYAQATRKIFDECGYSAQVLTDISGNERFVTANLNR